MSKLIYTVEWEGDVTNYKQEFETIDEARIALAIHHKRNAHLKIQKLEE